MRATLLILAGFAAAACGAIVAPAAIAAAESAELTIATLEAQGFDVKVNRIGSAPLDECVVTDGVRVPPGASYRRSILLPAAQHAVRTAPLSL